MKSCVGSRVDVQPSLLICHRRIRKGLGESIGNTYALLFQRHLIFEENFVNIIRKNVPEYSLFVFVDESALYVGCNWSTLNREGPRLLAIRGHRAPNGASSDAWGGCHT